MQTFKLLSTLATFVAVAQAGLLAQPDAKEFQGALNNLQASVSIPEDYVTGTDLPTELPSGYNPSHLPTETPIGYPSEDASEEASDDVSGYPTGDASEDDDSEDVSDYPEPTGGDVEHSDDEDCSEGEESYSDGDCTEGEESYSDDESCDEEHEDSDSEDTYPTAGEEQPTDEQPTDEQPTDEQPTYEQSTEEPSYSAKPTEEPSYSAKPTGKPSYSAKPTEEPSYSAKPSEEPSSEEEPSETYEAKPTNEAPAPAPAAAAPASAPAAGTYSGDATYYTPGLGACEATNTASDHIAALNSPQFGNWARYLNSPFCVNTCALVKGPKGQVKVKIVDRCPECKRGDLDLSPAAFDLIADAAKGRVEISWSWTSCDGVKA